MDEKKTETWDALVCFRGFSCLPQVRRGDFFYSL